MAHCYQTRSLWIGQDELLVLFLWFPLLWGNKCASRSVMLGKITTQVTTVATYQINIVCVAWILYLTYFPQISTALCMYNKKEKIVFESWEIDPKYISTLLAWKNNFHLHVHNTCICTFTCECTHVHTFSVSAFIAKADFHLKCVKKLSQRMCKVNLMSEYSVSHE